MQCYGYSLSQLFNQQLVDTVYIFRWGMVREYIFIKISNIKFWLLTTFCLSSATSVQDY